MDPNADFSIKKIKFKPGYQNIWREARTVLKSTLNLNFRYQARLTTYLLRFNKLVSAKTYLYLETRLNNIILNSKLLTDINMINTFIENGFFFINGFLCLNPFMQVLKNDFIQLVVTMNYYVIYKWISNWLIVKKIRLKNKSKKKLKSFSLADDKQKSFDLPKWISNNKNLFEDCSKFLEIDYFTLSIFCLYEPLQWSDVNSFNFLETRFSIINLYNWKYIN